MNRTGRSAAGIFAAVLAAAVIAVLVLFAPATPASGAGPARGDAGVGAAVPGAPDVDASRWGAPRQPRATVGPATGNDPVSPFAVLGVAVLVAVGLVLLGACVPSQPRTRWAAAVRLPAVRAPPATG